MWDKPTHQPIRMSRRTSVARPSRGIVPEDLKVGTNRVGNMKKPRPNLFMYVCVCISTILLGKGPARLLIRQSIPPWDKPDHTAYCLSKPLTSSLDCVHCNYPDGCIGKLGCGRFGRLPIAACSLHIRRNALHAIKLGSCVHMPDTPSSILFRPTCSRRYLRVACLRSCRYLYF